MIRMALGVEYLGGAYAGFQRQPGRRTVQGELERALGIIADEPVTLQCAGRTDAGVSATGQVVHIDVTKRRRRSAYVMGANTHLPPDIAVTWACETAEDFHARFSACARRYRYLLQNTPARPALMHAHAGHCRYPLRLEPMRRAAAVVVGEHDFTSFCSADEQSPSAWRCVHYFTVERRGDFFVFDVEANAFLNHMVRNMVGALLQVGQGRRDEEWFAAVLKGRDRALAGPGAPPQGLCLTGVVYPSRFDLPRLEVAPEPSAVPGRTIWGMPGDF